MFPKVIQVIPYTDYNVDIYFEDGKIICYNASQLLNKKVFEPLNDIEFFTNACTKLNDTLAWDATEKRDGRECLDIDPDMLYALEVAAERIV